MDRKNLAILIPTLGRGGAERVVSNLSSYLAQKYNLFLVLNNSQVIEYPYEGQLIDLNTPAKGGIYKAINYIKRLHRVNKIKQKYEFDVSISFLESSNIVNLFTRQKDKLILSIRNHLPKGKKTFYGQLHKAFLLLFYNKADVIVAVSEGIKKDLVDHFSIREDKIIVIYNPYDLDNINSLSQEALHDQHNHIFEHDVIINVGRLSYQKGQWHLIRAFRKVKAQHPHAKLVILGEGKLKEYLHNLIVQLGLENDVFLLGMQDNPFKYIHHSKLFVLSSLFEGFPNALVEAIACGTPVVAHDCRTGPREILAPGTDAFYQTASIEYAEYGILIPVCDGKQYKSHEPLTNEESIMAEAINGILLNSEKRLYYQNISTERAKDFSIHNLVNAWLELIDN